MVLWTNTVLNVSEDGHGAQLCHLGSCHQKRPGMAWSWDPSQEKQHMVCTLAPECRLRMMVIAMAWRLIEVLNFFFLWPLKRWDMCQSLIWKDVALPVSHGERLIIVIPSEESQKHGRELRCLTRACYNKDIISTCAQSCAGFQFASRHNSKCRLCPLKP